MLHWIQAQYGAEIVTLTVELGQPDENWDAITQKARDMGAAETLVVDAREEFAADFVAPAIRANALYGGGYPLFTALARPLIARIAVEAAREHGCDTIAHGCTGKGNDQVRIDSTIATLGPELRVAGAGPGVGDGPRGGDRLRPRAPDTGLRRDREAAVLDRRQPLGPFVGGPCHRGHRQGRRRTTSSSSSRGPSRRRTSPRC